VVIAPLRHREPQLAASRVYAMIALPCARLFHCCPMQALLGSLPRPPPFGSSSVSGAPLAGESAAAPRVAPSAEPVRDEVSCSGLATRCRVLLGYSMAGAAVAVLPLPSPST